MIDYQKYRDHVRLSNADFISMLQRKFPKFTKVDASFIAHPDEHGLCLTKEAEQHLIDNCGAGPGLAHFRFTVFQKLRRKQ